jgi:Abnormal spindle-like microcephaly-assoc'd, ASPM-SPD-2-Hydin
MSHLPTRWNALAVVLALATMLGCQGLSTSKPASQGQNPLPGALSAAPTSVNFGNVPIGTSQALSGTLSNTGGTGLTITQSTVTGTGFSLTGITLPVTLTPGQSTAFSVVFNPQSGGSASGNLALTNNGASSPVNVALSGTAVAAGSQAALSVSSVNLGSVTVGTSGTQTGSLTATGAAVTVSSVSLSGTNPSEFSISGLSFPVTVTTSQPVVFTVTFTPGASGTASATASFTSTASNSPAATTLAGTGSAAPVHTVSLSWTASATAGVTSYNVYRAVYETNACGSYSNLGSTVSSITAYTDSVVADGTTYCYATTAVDPSGESGYSNITQAVIPPP